MEKVLYFNVEKNFREKSILLSLFEILAFVPMMLVSIIVNEISYEFYSVLLMSGMPRKLCLSKEVLGARWNRTLQLDGIMTLHVR